MPASALGAMILGLPALAVAWWFLWKRHRPIFWFALAMILIGLGYLAATGATGEIGRMIAPNWTSPISQPAPRR